MKIDKCKNVRVVRNKLRQQIKTLFFFSFWELPGASFRKKVESQAGTRSNESRVHKMVPNKNK